MAVVENKKYSCEESRVEFIDGEIFYQATSTLRHQNICNNIIVEFKRYFRNKSCHAFSAPHDIILDDGVEKKRVQPDGVCFMWKIRLGPK